MNQNTTDSTFHNDEDSTTVSSSRSVVASGTRSMGVTGCEDNPINELSRLRLGQPLKLATWNCGGLSFTIQEMCRELNYDALVLTETHDQGKLASSRNFITADPVPESDPYAGVAIMLSERMAKCIKHKGCYGSRIVFVEINADPCNLFLIGIYIPHIGRKRAPFAHDTICQLRQLLDKVSTSKCVVLLGDLNCKLGRDIENLTGKWCIHKKPNSNGDKLLEVMRNYNLSAASTLFKPGKRRFSPSRSNATYLPKDNAYKPSQIDYILISSRWATGIKDCKVKWGLSCQRWGRYYDHGMVVCSFVSKIQKVKTSPTRDYSMLKSDPSIQSAFDQAVKTNLDNLEYDTQDPAKSYSAMVTAITEAANSTIPMKKSKPLRKRQVSSQTRELYNMRKNNFEKMSTDQCKQSQNSIVKSIRNDYLA